MNILNVISCRLRSPTPPPHHPLASSLLQTLARSVSRGEETRCLKSASLQNAFQIKWRRCFIHRWGFPPASERERKKGEKNTTKLQQVKKHKAWIRASSPCLLSKYHRYYSPLQRCVFFLAMYKFIKEKKATSVFKLQRMKADGVQEALLSFFYPSVCSTSAKTMYFFPNRAIWQRFSYFKWTLTSSSKLKKKVVL